MLVLVLAVLVVSSAYPLRSWFAQRAQIAELRAEQTRLTDDIAALQAQTLRWEDPAYVKAQARQRLAFVLPGEVGYTVVGAAPARSAQKRAAAARVDQSQPWWTRMWSSVEQADGSAGR